MRYWPSNDDGEPPPMLYEAGSGPGEAPILFENARGACMILNLAESGEPCGGGYWQFPYHIHQQFQMSLLPLSVSSCCHAF